MDTSVPRAGTADDWALYAKFKDGDLSAFRELFQKHKTRLINLSYRFVHRREAAEDIAQEVLIKVYEKKVQADANAKFSTWLYRVTVNASMDYLRSKRNRSVSLDEASDYEDGDTTLLDRIADPASMPPEKILEAEERQSFVRNAVEGLPENLKPCLLLYQFEEMSYLEIAKILGITEKAVERRLYHAKQILREALSKYVQ